MRRRKNHLLGFIVVIISGPMTMTKRNPHHFAKALVTRHIVKQT